MFEVSAFSDGFQTGTKRRPLWNNAGVNAEFGEGDYFDKRIVLLDQVDNTADTDKPLSTPVENYLVENYTTADAFRLGLLLLNRYAETRLFVRGNNTTTVNQTGATYTLTGANFTVTAVALDTNIVKSHHLLQYTVNNTSAKYGYFDVDSPKTIGESWFYEAVFSPVTMLTKGQFIFGMAFVATTDLVAPDTQSNLIGVGRHINSNNLHVFISGSATTQKWDLGANFPCNTNYADLYAVRIIYDKSVAGTVRVIVQNRVTGAISDATYTGSGTGFPASNILLYPFMQVSNNGSVTESNVLAFSEFRSARLY